MVENMQKAKELWWVDDVNPRRSNFEFMKQEKRGCIVGTADELGVEKRQIINRDREIEGEWKFERDEWRKSKRDDK